MVTSHACVLLSELQSVAVSRVWFKDERPAHFSLASRLTCCWCCSMFALHAPLALGFLLITALAWQSVLSHRIAFEH